MKISTLISLLAFSSTSFAQNTAATDSSDQDIIVKNVDIGLSVGFNTVFEKLHEARISPIDQKVFLTNMPRQSFLLSTTISVPFNVTLRQGKENAKQIQYQQVRNGPFYRTPLGLCFVASLNLANLSSTQSGSIFNKKIDGGLGLGYRVSQNFQISLTYEKISIRQPRQFLKDLEGKNIIINNQILNSLDIEDNNYFVDKYLNSAAIKFIYVIKNGTKGTVIE